MTEQASQEKQPLREIITYCDDTCPFCCPRQEKSGNAEYLKIVARTYGTDIGDFTDEVLFVGSKFQEGVSEHSEKQAFCQCPRCAKSRSK